MSSNCDQKFLNEALSNITDEDIDFLISISEAEWLEIFDLMEKQIKKSF